MLYVYDYVAFLIINIIGLNVLFGIIIDTFKQLRNDRVIKIEDRNSICFICGRERSDFEKNLPGGFDYHKKYEHNLWDY